MNFKQIFFLIILFTAKTTFAQQNRIEISKSNTAATNQYVVNVVGVETKQICIDLENTISKKEGVISFKTVGFPSKYFVLKATKPILEADLKSWLLENNVKLTLFKNSLLLNEL
jgi:hypothetical protein